MRKIEIGHEVEVARAIFRDRTLYAAQGEIGEVIGVFKTQPYRHGSTVVWHAKVRMEGSGVIKTFRVTSLTRRQGNPIPRTSAAQR